MVQNSSASVQPRASQLPKTAEWLWLLMLVASRRARWLLVELGRLGPWQVMATWSLEGHQLGPRSKGSNEEHSPELQVILRWAQLGH